ncbi:MAG: gamma-glutamylcyclotransferase family protein [Longimicrobiales bacterium]
MRTHVHIFAYGTLLDRGAGLDALLDGSSRLRRAQLRGTLYDLGRFPALVIGGSGIVHGEILRVPAERVPELDRYEGVDSGTFRRIATEVAGTACWTYVAGPRLAARLTPERRIDSGCWRDLRPELARP